MQMPLAISPARLWRKMVRAASLARLRRAGLTTAKARLGRAGEEAAYWHLREQGFVMVARNYRPEGLKGEIDLIGWEGGTLVFVEVKSRSRTDLQAPEAAVDRAKQGHVLAAARQYRHHARQESAPVRFDIVSVEYSNENATDAPRIQHLREAFR
ncbi:MAG: YraN family protein [Acidobacteria bacterium]|nr:YraN family protein [Acidobacteriota bacterium]